MLDYVLHTAIMTVWMAVWGMNYTWYLSVHFCSRYSTDSHWYAVCKLYTVRKPVVRQHPKNVSGRVWEHFGLCFVLSDTAW